MAEAMSFKTRADVEREVEFHAKLVMLCNYGLGLLMLASVELGCGATTARALLALEPLCLSGTINIALRDLYVLQVGKGRRLNSIAFEACLRDHFGPSLPANLRSKLFLARHHLDLGKFAKGHRQSKKKA